MRHLVIVIVATGMVDGEWRGEGAPPLKAGTIQIDAAPFGSGPFIGKRWNGSAFVTPAAARRRILTAGDWWERWTDAETVRLEELSEAATQGGRQIRAFLRAIQIAGAIDLDKPALATKLNRIATAFLAAGVWANQAEADTRIAALLADA